MDAAIDAVKTSRMSITAAAKEYSVPKSTLDDRVLGKGKYPRAGRCTLLSSEDETLVAETCQLFSEWGFPLTKNNVLGIVGDFCKDKGIKPFNAKGPGRHWWDGFLKRNPSICVRKPQALQIYCAKAATREHLDHFYINVLKKDLDRLGLINKPEQIFNVDETSFCLSGRTQNVITAKGDKAPQMVIGGTGRENITVQTCISAAGKILPPLIVYTGQRLSPTLTMGGPCGARYCVSPNGWMTTTAFLDWFQNLLILRSGLFFYFLMGMSPTLSMRCANLL